MREYSEVFEPRIPLTTTVVDVKLRFTEDGIMCCYLNEEPEDQIAFLQKMVITIGRMTGFRKVPLLIIHEGTFHPTTEARTIWADSQNALYSLADAFVLQSISLTLIGNFYLNFHKPDRPTRIFDNKKEALAWLKGMAI